MQFFLQYYTIDPAYYSGPLPDLNFTLCRVVAHCTMHHTVCNRRSRFSKIKAYILYGAVAFRIVEVTCCGVPFSTSIIICIISATLSSFVYPSWANLRQLFFFPVKGIFVPARNFNSSSWFEILIGQNPPHHLTLRRLTQPLPALSAVPLRL